MFQFFAYNNFDCIPVNRKKNNIIIVKITNFLRIFAPNNNIKTIENRRDRILKTGASQISRIIK